MFINVIWVLLVVVIAMVFLALLERKVSKKKSNQIKTTKVKKNNSLSESKRSKNNEVLV